MRILTGIQSSGALHLGNYFGAMRPAIELQERGETFYFIADYHSMTSLTDPVRRREYTRDVALDFLACGLDPARCVFWRQSDVPAVTELAWLLSTVTPMGLLERAHSYKDKMAHLADGDLEKVNHGLFAYPVLMAADILLFDSNVVPVGRDQKQHLEMTRDIAGKFNALYGEVFVIPEPHIQDAVAVVPGIDGRKMSKSYGNTIEIFSDEKSLKKKVMSIKTDSRLPAEPKPDADQNLAIQLLKLVAPADVAAAMEERLRAGGTGYGDVKKALLEHCWDHFAEARRRRAELAADPGHVERILQDGAARAAEVASRVIARAKAACGLSH
ncbi:MAG: tryptophan--tRNA ligase [Verrucomicrobia bacterium]|nr:tryptophan--tRNA ligase [Verrucomicrobiota bacterium]